MNTDTDKAPFKPEVYDTSDLGELNTFCWEKHQTRFDFNEAIKTQKGVAEIFSECNYDTLVLHLRANTDNPNAVAVAYSSEQVIIMAEHPEYRRNIKRLYFIKAAEEMNTATTQAIKKLVSECGIEVRIKEVAFSSVATEGQYRHFKDVKVINGWHFMVAADNHDLYECHFEDSQYTDGVFLIFPRSVPLKKGMSIAAGAQANMDARRHARLMQQVNAYRHNCAVLNKAAQSMDNINLMPASYC